jgi:threonine dehydratase
MFEEVEAALDRIRQVTHKTPVMTSRTVNTLVGGEVFLKCENFQRVGAFKFRGAYNAISQLTPKERRRGVITHSSGNHAQAVALAAILLGVKATIVMPENSSPVKLEATSGYGAKIEKCGNSIAEREQRTTELIEKHGYTLIHPYNDLRVIHGAGTAAYELIKEVGPLDWVFAPVGGGGLLSGTAIATKGLCPSANVIGVEPKNADDAYRSVKEGRIIPSNNPQTIADGLRTSLGSHTFKIIQDKVDDIVTVTEKEILTAMRILWERMKLVVEPSGAVAMAGLLYSGLPVDGQKIGVILSGGNIDLNDFFAYLEGQIRDS